MVMTGGGLDKVLEPRVWVTLAVQGGEDISMACSPEELQDLREQLRLQATAAKRIAAPAK